MKTGFPLIIILFITTFTTFGCKEVEAVSGCDFPSDIEDAYTLVWSDEFDGAAIDASKWDYDLQDGCQISNDLCGWGNNELQYYTQRDDNARIENGKLVIEALKESPQYLGAHEYTSARMVTRGKASWRYGRVDVRAKLPIGQGLWPAIWMLPEDNAYGGWPRSGEIDIMEYTGDKPNEVFGTIHYGHDGWRFTSEEYVKAEGPNFHEAFHTYTLLWNEDCIQMMVDGELVSGPHSRTTTLPTTWPFDQRFHLILNVAVGGNLPGNPDATTQFPQRMEVDYVRVYEE
ncbi:MAG: glycoside hydrolase family 16 protein [Bacteroidota bacterium]